MRILPDYRLFVKLLTIVCISVTSEEVKKYFILAGFILILTLIIWGKPKLASYLLVEELSSEQKVRENITLANKSELDSTKVTFNNEEITFDNIQLNQLAQSANDIENVLGDSSDRWIEINLTQQRLYGWEGSRQVFNYLVSTGLWAKTPTGNYNVWIKLKSTTMKGGSKALGTYYYLTQVPCVMYFYRGYGIHGAYWHNNFGHPMSHGCVNMRPNEACEVFNWASVGTRVNIHY